LNIKKAVKKYLSLLFPSPRSYFNMWMLLLFSGILMITDDPLFIMIAAFAVAYFVNEWIKAIPKGEWQKALLIIRKEDGTTKTVRCKLDGDLRDALFGGKQVLIETEDGEHYWLKPWVEETT
jgi:hypothetical protein